MVECKIEKTLIKSEDIKNILMLRDDFEYVRDISNTINQKDIMVFDCKLSQAIFDLEDVEEFLEEMDISCFDVLYEDICAYLKDAADEIEAQIQIEYNFDNVRCYFDIYNIDDDFTDFKFVLVVSFADAKMLSLMNLASIVAKRQLVGASKFYS
jgi:hypothetical protein